MSDSPQPASVLIVGAACWRENLAATLGQCPGVELKMVETPSATVEALLTRRWTVVVYLLEGDSSSMLELAASLDGISRCNPSLGLDSPGAPSPLEPPCQRLGLRPGGFPPTNPVPPGIDRLEACPVSPADCLRWFHSPTPGADEGPTFDSDELIDRMMGNEMLAKRVVSVFLDDAPRQLLALAEALEKHDAATGSRIAHSLRGSASNAGGEALIELARTIESGCKSGELEQARRILPELHNRFSRLKPKLEAFVR